MSFFRENFRLKKMKRKVSWFMLLFLVCFQPGKVFAQDQKVTLDFVNAKVEDVFTEINRQTGMGFVYNRTQLQTINPVTVQVENVTVNEALAQLLKDKPFKYRFEGTTIVIWREAPKAETQQPQINLVPIKGRVVDENGNPLPGATIVIHGTSMGVATDADGRYTINAKPDDVLVFSFVGYKEQVIPLQGKTTMNVNLVPTAENLEEAVVVAFGTQKKESVVGAIQTVRPMDLKSSSSDLTTSFVGKIAGIVGWQTGGLPGALTEEEMNTKFYIRGISSSNGVSEPLVLIDGVESSRLDLSRMAPEDIESFSVLKDASATAMYGARGANNPEASPVYSVERIERTGNPNYPSFVYPSNDWYDILFKDYSINHRLGVNVRGGSNVVQYYASVNYNRDAGMLKTDQLNQFDVNITNSTLASRINLNVNLNAGIQLLLNTSFNIDKYHGPYADVTQAYAMAFNASPVDFAPVYPADKEHSWPHLRFGSRVDGSGNNPYAYIQQGYNERNRFSATIRMEYIHNLSQLLKGLELRASASYYQTGYDFETGEHTLISTSPIANRTLYLDGTQGAQTSSWQWVYEGRLLHTAAWGGVDNTLHQTSLTAVFQAQQSNSTPVVSLFEGFERRNLSFSMRGTYGFRDKYFLEGSFGYNGSERFAKQNRMGFFPAAGAAWIVSKENFMQNISKWFSYFKLRASWGKVGNDGIISQPRFVYMPQLGTYGRYTWLEPGNANTFARNQIQNYGDPDVQWEISEQVNLGVETRFFKDILEVNADFYQEIRHHIIDNREVIPANMGVELYPLDNIGKVRSRGVDLAAKVQHAFSPDFWLILNGTFTYSKAVYKELEEATDRPEWQQHVGHDISQQVGYIAEGLFYDQAEIDNAPSQPTAMPGDIRYRDINNDGVIDVEDAVHIGFPETPRIIYGFSGFINYKNWEFNFAFQGSGQRGFFLNAEALSPFVDDHAMLKEIAESHWTEDNMDNHPFWPRLSVNNIVEYNPQEDWDTSADTRKSTYFMRECSFLRCTALELAYNLPKSVTNKIRMQNVKFFARANNPFLISNFKLWDVELGENGFNYPIQKTFALGLNFSF